jgi:glycosyltransferase involved in cell wall biosynthesis
MKAVSSTFIPGLNAPTPTVATPSTSKAARVVIATVNTPKGETGVHTHTEALHSGLLAAGIDCSVVSPFSRGPMWIPVFALKRLFVSPINKTWATRYYRFWHLVGLRQVLTRELAQEPADVVIAQCPLSARAALDARDKLRANFRVAMVVHFNYSEATEYRDRGELKDEKAYQAVLDLETNAVQGVDQMIYVSGWAKNVIERERCLPTRKSDVIWNGIASSVDVAPARRATLGLTNDDLVIISVGTLEPRKNQIEMLDLFAKVVAEFANAKLVLIGDGAQRGEIEAKIEKLGLKSNVLLLGHRADVSALLPMADLYIHYAKKENCPVALIEAARAGLPIAAIPTGGTGELLEQLGPTIRLSETDANASLNLLRPILSDSGFRRDAGQKTLQRFQQRFSREAMVAAYVEALALR